MKKLHFVKLNDLSRLHDELLAAIPNLRPLPAGPVMTVEGLGDDIWLTVPDGAGEASIAAVVQAHDHSAPRPLTPAQQAYAAATPAAREAMIARRLGFLP